MHKILKSVFIISIPVALTACTPNLPYEPKTAELAMLTIDMPYKYQASAEVHVITNKNRPSDYKILYVGTNPQHNRDLPVDANVSLMLQVTYILKQNINSTESCNMNVVFTPKQYQRYVLTVGDEPGKKSNFMKELLLGPTPDNCLLAVGQRVGGGLQSVPIKKL